MDVEEEETTMIAMTINDLRAAREGAAAAPAAACLLGMLLKLACCWHAGARARVHSLG